MDIERPHRASAPTTTSELFICFTSRLSKSSSLRLSSKSILSPARTADKTSQPLSLSSSLSRRLRHNGSLRGAQSPAMFPSKKNKGSSGFADNPEPSSPKVTCIGQVRVKTKKQGKKMKMRACRSKKLSGGEASFRRIEHPHEGLTQGIQSQQSQDCGLNHRNQRWVHLPLTICEALKAFGNEFSCLFPCKSSCFSTGICGGEKGEKGEVRESSPTSCAVFRWLVSLQEGEGEGKRRDIELVVGGEEEYRQVREEDIIMDRVCSRRRSIFDDMEFDDLFDNVNKENNNEEVEEEEGARVSICIPPKNALLLMRCRSDPAKMASLSRKLWEAPLPQDVEDEEEEDGRQVEEIKVEKEDKLMEETQVMEDEAEDINMGVDKIDEMLENWAEIESNFEDLPNYIGEEEQIQDEEQKETEVNELKSEEEEHERELKHSIENRGIPEHHKFDISEETQLMEDETEINHEFGDNGQDLVVDFVENQEGEENISESDDLSSEMLSGNSNSVVQQEEGKAIESDDLSIELVSGNGNSVLQHKEKIEKAESSDLSTCTTSSSSSNASEESTAESKEEQEDLIEVEEEEQRQEARKSMGEESKEKRENNKPTLPDCLLLMMCEPKVSIEVSKETWVCSSDFIRWLPERHPKKTVKKADGSEDSTKRKPPMAAPPQYTQRFEPATQPPVQPARSSISFPAGGGSVANLIEQKLVKAGGYEPLVLTRCKSAPMRSTAKIASSEMACSLWGRDNGRKLEPHRPATFGVGAAGVGF